MRMGLASLKIRVGIRRWWREHDGKWRRVELLVGFGVGMAWWFKLS